MSMITYPLNNIEYTAEDAELFHSTRTSGVYANNSFDYSLSGFDNTIVIGPGIAWIKNSEFSGKVVAQKEPISLDVGIPDPIYPRIDAVIIQFDSNKNSSEIIVKSGEPSSNPIAPNVVRTETVYELHLYHVKRDAGSLSISANSVSDLRTNDSYCGLMSDSVTQSVDITLSKRGVAADSATVGKSLAGKAPLYNNAGAHNSIYRGKKLGTSVTAAQYAAIEAGTFNDMYIGDYWVIDGVTYRIAAFDYYYRTGDTSCNTHHVTLVPDVNMYTHSMNDTNITTGAYVGSKMYTEGLTQAKTTINSAFGEAHVLNHRQYLQNATTDGYASGGSWYDSTVELMTEQNVYGSKIFGNCQNGTALPNSYTVDKSQYPMFAFRPDMISNRAWFWLRDVASAARFAYVTNDGTADCNNASNAAGVRPAFSIIG